MPKILMGREREGKDWCDHAMLGDSLSGDGRDIFTIKKKWNDCGSLVKTWEISYNMCKGKGQVSFYSESSIIWVSEINWQQTDQQKKKHTNLLEHMCGTLKNKRLQEGPDGWGLNINSILSYWKKLELGAPVGVGARWWLKLWEGEGEKHKKQRWFCYADDVSGSSPRKNGW